MILAVATVGCSELDKPDSGGGRLSGWSQIPLPTASADSAFEAGVYAMGQWFHLAETSAAGGIVRGAAEEFRQKGGTGRIRDEAIGYSNRMRRTATLMIRAQGTGSIARCRVQVQRLDTADHRVFGRNEQFGDVPSETPIDREAGVSAGQNQVWTDMPRDRELERNILNLLRRRVSGDASA